METWAAYACGAAASLATSHLSCGLLQRENKEREPYHSQKAVQSHVPQRACLWVEFELVAFSFSSFCSLRTAYGFVYLQHLKKNGARHR